jgi:hypothetical protein
MRLFVPLLSCWKCVSKLAFQQIQLWKSGWVILGPKWVFSVYSFRINKPNIWHHTYYIFLCNINDKQTMSCSNLPSSRKDSIHFDSPDSRQSSEWWLKKSIIKFCTFLLIEWTKRKLGSFWQLFLGSLICKNVDRSNNYMWYNLRLFNYTIV